MKILGVDFTSAPQRSKPIVCAWGELSSNGILTILELVRCDDKDFKKFEHELERPGPWVGGFDFPFGMPRRFVRENLHANDWESMVSELEQMKKQRFCELTWEAFRAAKGDNPRKQRAIDQWAKSHSPLKTMDWSRRQTINPPVGLMFFEGAKRLIQARLHVPALSHRQSDRVALEAYPGHLAASVLGKKISYKNDPPQGAAARIEARRHILKVLASGDFNLNIPVVMGEHLAALAVADRGGDILDAVLCAVQAAWGARRAEQRFGLPADVDPLEGWIVSVERNA